MIKHAVHIIRVKRSGEKIQFQVKIPRNTKRIIALKVTANPKIKLVKKIAPDYSEVAGWLWLRIPERRDVFYADLVRRPLPLHSQTISGLRPIDDFDQGTFWTQGTKEDFFEVDVSVQTNILEGFYIDMIRQEDGRMEPPIKDPPIKERPKPPKGYDPLKMEKPKPEKPKPEEPPVGNQKGYEVRIYLKLEV